MGENFHDLDFHKISLQENWIMCDVTCKNFDEVLPKIENSIKNCNFIAFDSEFSALSLSENHSTRYKSRRNNEKFVENLFRIPLFFLVCLMTEHNGMRNIEIQPRKVKSFSSDCPYSPRIPLRIMSPNPTIFTFVPNLSGMW